MSTPMAIDSPMGVAALSSSKANGANALPQTAKISDMISLYRPTKHFRHAPAGSGPGKPQLPPNTIVSLDFDDEGGLLLTSESDNSMQIYNVKEGRHHKTHLSQKYGVSNAMFGHAMGCIIHASTKVNHTIRYLSTHDNTYLRYFEGHTSTVTSLALHPGADNFLSCSEDNSLRIWDAATKNHCGRLDLHGAYLAAWDPSGNVFAVASPTAQSILLYDFRNYDKEPFSTFDILPHTQQLSGLGGRGWSKLEFSNDGKSILLGTTGTGHLLLDAFDGDLKTVLRRNRTSSRRLAPGDHNPEHVNHHSSEWQHPSIGDVCFTADGRYVISGTRSDKVLVWDTLVATQDKILDPIHEFDGKGEAAVVAFNPRHNFFATADKEVVFWVPDLSFA